MVEETNFTTGAFRGTEPVCLIALYLSHDFTCQECAGTYNLQAKKSTFSTRLGCGNTVPQQKQNEKK